MDYMRVEPLLDFVKSLVLARLHYIAHSREKEIRTPDFLLPKQAP